MQRCPETDSVQIGDETVTLQCVYWSEDPEGRHPGDHMVYVPPIYGGEHTWPNTNPLPEG